VLSVNFFPSREDFGVRWLDTALNIGGLTPMATRQGAPQESAVKPAHSKARWLRRRRAALFCGKN